MQYLTFRLGEELFGVSLEKVREIQEMGYITCVPRTPGFLTGVMNIRGSVVTVIDLCKRMGIKSCDQHGVDTSIVVLELVIENDEMLVGVIVDNVDQVREIPGNAIEPPPKIGMELDTEFMEGIGKVEDSFAILLNIESLFSLEALGL